MTRSKRDRPRGLSLLEVTIAGVILVTLIFMVFSVLHQSQTAAAIGGATGEAEARGQRDLDACKGELMFAKIVMSDFPSAKSSIRYQLPNKTGALAYAERVRQVIEQQTFPYGAVTASIGVASMPEDVATAEELMRAAQRAMRTAKRLGRNRVSPA